MKPSGIVKTVLVDLRCCQVNQDRGIPAYAQELLLHLGAGSPEHRYLWFIEKGKPLPPREAELSTLGQWRTEAQLRSDASLQVDALLSTWLFMDPGGRGEAFLLPPWLKTHSPLKLGIVYDLIPLLFPERYLQPEAARGAFLAALRQMKTYDRLFAISEATRRDAIRHGGMDPARIITLPGGIDGRKARLLDRASAPNVPAALGLGRNYFIYVGGEDWRKNMDGLVRAFAAFRSASPAVDAPQLAIVCKMSEQRKRQLMDLAASLGLPTGAVVCTGHLPDDAFIALTRGAEAMVFPSLYEGLGLPILEAYASGVPVLGSDNSSIRDLVHPRCRFDPSSVESIAEALARFRREPSLSEASLAFGREVLSALNWSKSAELVSQSLAEPRCPAHRQLPRSRIAVAGVLPPQDTGIAAYTLRHLQSADWGTDFFTESTPRLAAEGDQELRSGNRVLPQEIMPLALRRGIHSHAVFVLGNSPHHAGALEALLATRMETTTSRWAYLHEADIWALIAHVLGAASNRLLPEVADPGPSSAPAWIRRALKTFPGLRPGLQFLRRKGRLDGLLVNSIACRDLIRAALGPEAEGWSIRTLFLPIAEPPHFPARAGSRALTVGFFGVPALNKLPKLVVGAFDLLRRETEANLVLAGWGMRAFCETHGLLGREDVTCLESPSDEALAHAMASVDVAVQLRVPTIGETSGVVGQLLALEKAVIVTGEGSYAELEDPRVLKVPADVTAPELATRMAQANRQDAAGGREKLLATYGAEAYEARLAEVLGLRAEISGKVGA